MNSKSHNRSCITTYKGYQLDFADPNPELISIFDIAQGLSNTCRFAGQCTPFYSVAEHCLYLSKMFNNPTYKLAALLHDAAEAYMTDLPTPLKQMLPDYINVEKKLLTIIFSKLGVGDLFNIINTPLFKKAEEQLLATEVKELLTNSDGWEFIEKPLPKSQLEIMCYSPGVASELYLTAHRDLIYAHFRGA